MKRTEIESTSSLINACRLCGATYSPKSITLADGLVVELRSGHCSWTLTYDDFSVALRKGLTKARLQFEILDLHTKILRKNLARA